MRRTLLLCTAALFTSATMWAQTPAAQPAPATPAPARATTAKPSAKPSTITIQVTDATGAPLPDATVTVTGTLSREGVTGADGLMRLMNMRAGTYRLRFTREGSITLERDVTLRAGESPTIEVTLSPAPIAPKAPVAPPAPVAPVAPGLGPPVAPKVTPVPIFLEKNFIGGREGRKDSALGCTTTGTATLHQLRDTWQPHAHDDAEEWIYVVAGEGVLRIAGSDQKMQAGTFSLVPHTISHALIPQGRNPLIVISVLSGAPCNQ